MTRKPNSKWMPCRFPCCETRILRATQFFCWEHWVALPRALQDELVAVDRRDGRHRAVELIPGAVRAISRSLGIPTEGGDGAATEPATEGQ